MQVNFGLAFNLIKSQFTKVITTMDSIKLYGNFSILEFFIALLVLGAILPILIITIANWSSEGFSASLRAEDRANRAERYAKMDARYAKLDAKYNNKH